MTQASKAPWSRPKSSPKAWGIAVRWEPFPSSLSHLDTTCPSYIFSSYLIVFDFDWLWPFWCEQHLCFCQVAYGTPQRSWRIQAAGCASVHQRWKSRTNDISMATLSYLLFRESCRYCEAMEVDKSFALWGDVNRLALIEVVACSQGSSVPSRHVRRERSEPVCLATNPKALRTAMHLRQICLQFWTGCANFHVHNEDELNLTPATAVIADCFGYHGDSPPEIERNASISWAHAHAKV